MCQEGPATLMVPYRPPLANGFVDFFANKYSAQTRCVTSLPTDFVQLQKLTNDKCPEIVIRWSELAWTAHEECVAVDGRAYEQSRTDFMAQLSNCHTETVLDHVLKGKLEKPPKPPDNWQVFPDIRMQFVDSVIKRYDEEHAGEAKVYGLQQPEGASLIDDQPSLPIKLIDDHHA